jgi:soluble lytic murein transglycosylase-like protein
MAVQASPQLSPWKQPIAAALNAAAERFGLEPALVRAVAWIESSGNPRAVSAVGAQGLMQLMPATSAMLGVRDPFDPLDNANGGAKYLAQLMKKVGQLEHALYAYNWGPGNVARGGPVPASVQKYARDVLARLEVERQFDPFYSAPAAAPTEVVAAPGHSFSCPHCGHSLRVVGGDRGA